MILYKIWGFQPQVQICLPRNSGTRQIQIAKQQTIIEDIRNRAFLTRYAILQRRYARI